MIESRDVEHEFMEYGHRACKKMTGKMINDLSGETCTSTCANATTEWTRMESQGQIYRKEERTKELQATL